MPRILVLVTICLLLLSCYHRVKYTPNPIDFEDPIAFIKKTIDEQPSAYATKYTNLEVTHDVIKVYFVDSGFMGLFGASGEGIPYNFFFKEMGEPELYKENVWSIVLMDKVGNDLYWIYAYDEAIAKSFYDAVVHMIENAKEES